MKKRLITSALPYVNNIPHLGNLIQVLSADVFARFCRQRGYETLYVCGTDEYGTATETKAREEGISPRELCDRFNAIHTEIYKWFGIQFDHFGRTSRQVQTEIVQDMFKKIYDNGYITQHTIEQLYSEKSDMFLADRYVRGTCPHCGYQEARGDQCENCGKLLEPTDLIDPKSQIDGTTPVVRQTKHLYINLPAIKDKLEAWIQTASVKGKWAKNAIQMTQGWIRDGLKERAITRDLKWGIPVPLAGFEHKVFYVWFDAPIGYISISADYTPEWKSWWKDTKDVELFQFIGKDNIPFHTVIFPASQIASGDNWTMLHHMSSTEFLNYEAGKFSKSKGVGVFGTDARDTGIPADVWRFYIFYNRPETSDYTFTWKDFQEKVNKELIGNLGNLVNRTLSFWNRFFPLASLELDLSIPLIADFHQQVKAAQVRTSEFLEWANLRDGFRNIFEISGMGNKLFQDNEPWKLRNNDPELARNILVSLLFLIRDLAIMVRPYMPASSDAILGVLGLDTQNVAWSTLAQWQLWPGPSEFAKPDLLFVQLEDDLIETLRLRFAGSQAEREARQNDAESKAQADAQAEILAPDQKVALSLEDQFTKSVELRVAKIVDIARHPDAEKLYIETLDDGSGTVRTIVSGLVPHYSEDQLLGKNIIVVANLKPAKLRGVVSAGMLLAASAPKPEGGEKVEVIFAPDAKPGDQVYLEGHSASGPCPTISIDNFFAIPLHCDNRNVLLGTTRLLVADKALVTHEVLNGEIG